MSTATPLLQFVHLQDLVGRVYQAMVKVGTAFKTLVGRDQAAVKKRAAIKALAGSQAPVAMVSAMSMDVVHAMLEEVLVGRVQATVAVGTVSVVAVIGPPWRKSWLIWAGPQSPWSAPRLRLPPAPREMSHYDITIIYMLMSRMGGVLSPTPKPLWTRRTSL